MWPFHRHDWQRFSEAYAPHIEKASSYDLKDLDQVARHGLTTIVLRCTKCSKLKTIKLLGHLEQTQLASGQLHSIAGGRPKGPYTK